MKAENRGISKYGGMAQTVSHPGLSTEYCGLKSHNMDGGMCNGCA